MIICEHTISEYTLNGNALYNVAIVYKISKSGKELLAQLTVELNPQRVRVDNIGTEWTDSAAEADRIRKLKMSAVHNVAKYAVCKSLEGADNFYRHVDYRK